MNINRLTQKAQEAVIAAQALAGRNGQPEIGTLHRLQALVDRNAEPLMATSNVTV